MRVPGSSSSFAIVLPLDGEDPPRAGNTLENVFTPIGEVDARADHQIDDGARHEHLARLRQG